MQFDSRRCVTLIAPTATPPLRQFVRQRYAATIFQDHRAEAPQQPDRHVLGRFDYHAGEFL
jgi:hypothetical protein